MAENKVDDVFESNIKADEGAVETKDRGLFGLIGKKEEEKKPKEGVIDKIKEKVSGGDHKEEEKVAVHHGTEPSYEPEEKKGFLDNIKEKLPVKKKTEEEEIPPPLPAKTAYTDSEAKDRKGFLDDIKEKLPVHKKTEESNPPPLPVESDSTDGEAKEKKGLLDKIKEKLPGHHPKTEEEKEKEGH